MSFKFNLVNYIKFFFFVALTVYLQGERARAREGPNVSGNSHSEATSSDAGNVSTAASAKNEAPGGTLLGTGMVLYCVFIFISASICMRFHSDTSICTYCLITKMK